MVFHGVHYNLNGSDLSLPEARCDPFLPKTQSQGELGYDTARELWMSYWRRIVGLGVLPMTLMLSACAPREAAIQGGSPLKATPHPSEIVLSATSTTRPDTKPSSTPGQCGAHQGSLVEDSYSLTGSDVSARFLAYLPPCYKPEERAYPVAFFLHGYPLDEEHWIDLGIVEIYEGLLAADLIDPMVLIFPYQPEPYFTQTDGGPSSLEQVLLENLEAAVEDHYRVSKQPSERALLGVSRGGVWALEIGMRHPDQFNIIAALSPALSYNHPRAAYDPFDIVLSADVLPDCILISSGDREPQFSGEIDRFAETLERSGVDFVYLQHEGRHENAAWQAILERVLLFVAMAVRGLPNGCS